MAEGRQAWPKVADDWFVEAAEVTSWLLAREYFVGGIWDPACGQGNVVEACLLDGKMAVGSDLRDRVTRRSRGGRCTPPWFLGARDFLAAKWLPNGCQNIIANPPYGHAALAEAFIRHTLELPGLQKAAFLLNGKFLFGAGRAQGLFRDHPPTRIYPIWPRPSIPPGAFLRAGGKASGGVENFVWIVYSPSEPGPTVIIW